MYKESPSYYSHKLHALIRTLIAQRPKTNHKCSSFFVQTEDKMNQFVD